jgi:hypothetical protein
MLHRGADQGEANEQLKALGAEHHAEAESWDATSAGATALVR